MQSSPDNPQNEYSLWKVIRNLNFKQELIYGSFAGFTICLVGHPFDTLKTYIQLSNTGSLNAIKSIYSHGGISSFYKGIMSPLASMSLLNAVIFASYESSREILAHSFNRSTHDYSIIFSAGAISGVINSLICGPIELFKIKKQMQINNTIITSYFDIFHDIKKISGNNGLFKGVYLTAIRDSIGFAFQFLIFQYVHRKLSESNLEQKVFPWHNFVAGGFAGCSCWVSAYQFDTIKSIYQAEWEKKKISWKFSGDAWRITVDIYTRFGIRGFYVGMGSIMGRAILANAAGFYAWDLAKQNIKI